MNDNSSASVGVHDKLTSFIAEDFNELVIVNISSDKAKEISGA